VRQGARTFYDVIDPLIAVELFYAFNDFLFVDVDNVIGLRTILSFWREMR